ncbi:MAG: hypothetical protein IH899_17125, partial [Planctomycetes bacterium]|nr:hypothetical protein [Planctomycetota bacterium]
MISLNSSIRFVSTGVLLWIATLALAQGTVSDYQRAEGLRERTRNKVFKLKIEPHWFAGNSRFWYRNDLSGGKREFILVDVAKGTRLPAFDHQRLAAAISKITGNEYKKSRLPFERIDFLDSPDVIAFRAAGKPWVCDLGN